MSYFILDPKGMNPVGKFSHQIMIRDNNLNLLGDGNRIKQPLYT